MAVNTKKFNEQYIKLNKAQKEAVDSIEGPVMVLAGPGTGKTQVLTLRIANILRKTDISPDSILTLTFTEAATQAMRGRLVDIIGSAAYQVNISTFHGFCNDIIHDWPEEFPKIIGANNISDVEQITILKDIIEREKLDVIRPYGDPFYYLKAISSSIDTLKREDISHEDFLKKVKKQETQLKKLEKGKKTDCLKAKRDAQKNRELALVYKSYQKELVGRQFYDYNDMIVEVIKELKKNKDLLLELQEKYLYLLADEHQDANHAQNKILELLSSYYKDPNLFIVGDEKQAIFRFQGASVNNFLFFRKRYPKIKLISLTHNYRSGQNILNAAHSLAQKNNTGVNSDNLRAVKKDTSGKINLLEFKKPESEQYFLASDIAKKIASGVQPGEIAVFYRNNKDAQPIAAMLEKQNIPYTIQSDQNVLDDDDIKKLIRLLEATNSFGVSEKLVSALHINFLSLDPLDVYKLIASAKKNKTSVFDSLAKTKKVGLLGFYKKLSSWRVLSKNKNLLPVFEAIVNDSGLIKYLLGTGNSNEKIGKLSAFFDEAKALVERNKNATLSDFINHLDTLKDYSVFLKKNIFSDGSEKVRLMTAHRSKGQEFEYVYLTGAYSGRWGGRKASQLFNLPQDNVYEELKNSNDERRLFYVALTRAQKEVNISYASQSQEGKERLATQFISDIDSTYLKKVSTDKIEKQLLGNQQLLLTQKTEKPKTDTKNKDFVRELFSTRGFSVTHLNNYRTCPWRYFYTNLLQVPMVPSKHQLYGIAVHSALKQFFDKLVRNGKASSNALLTLFKDSLVSLPLEKREFNESLKKGESALNGYYGQYNTVWHKNIINEFNIRGVVFSPEVTLTGKLDKVEMLDNAGHVNVVDYKTGQVKSKNFILGLTKNSTGDYWRQLVFYKLLLDRYDGGKYKMTSGEIDFIEPAPNGKHKKEVFEISESDIKELESTIKKTTDEILNLSFWDRRCDDKKCEFCALRDLMS